MATATKPPPVPLKVSRYWPPGLPGQNYAQAAFLAVPHRVVLFGGAAGPGKTMGLFMAALQYVDVPGYSAILLRRTYKQLTLPGQLLDIARNTLRGTDAKWVEKESRFDFPSGARIVFGHLDSDRDLEDALGPEYQFIGWDELTQFPKHHFDELFARLRKPKDPANPLSQVPLRVRAASNPGGRGHRWVKQEFMLAPDDDTLYIPARLQDNPGIDADEYMKSLAKLPRHRRQQMVDGDWDAKPTGAMFDRDWFHVIQPDEVPWDRLWQVRYWDAAATKETEENPDPDWTVGARLGFDPDTDDYYIAHMARFRDRPGGVDRRIRQMDEADEPEVRWVFEQEPGAAGKQIIHEWQRKFPHRSITGHRPSASKEARAAPWAARAEGVDQSEGGTFFVVEGAWVPDFLDEVEDFLTVEGGHDDQVDAVSGAYANVRRRRKRKVRVKPAGRAKKRRAKVKPVG